MDHEGELWDEITNKKLVRKEVVNARLVEITLLRSHGVCDKVPWQEYWQSTGKGPVKVKSIDINEGHGSITSTGCQAPVHEQTCGEGDRDG